MSSSFLQAAAWRDADRTGRRAAQAELAATIEKHMHLASEASREVYAGVDALLADAHRAPAKCRNDGVTAEVLHDVLSSPSHGRHREILALLPSLRHPASTACLRGALYDALRHGFNVWTDPPAVAMDAVAMESVRVDDGEVAGWFAGALREIGDSPALYVLVDFAVCDRLDFAHACRQALGAWEEASVGERPLAVAREFRVRLRDGRLVARALPGSGPTGAAKPHDDRRPPRSRDVAGGGYALFGPHRVEEEEDPFGDSPPGVF